MPGKVRADGAGCVPDPRRVAGRWALGAALLVLMASFLATAPSALAATCTDEWVAKSGSWNTAGDWSTGKVPSSSDIVCIDEKGTYTVTLEPSGSAYVSVKALQLGAGSGAGTQTLKLVGAAAEKGAYLEASEEVSISAHGAVHMTSSGGEYETRLVAQSGHVLANSGAIAAEAGSGGARRIGGAVANTGTVSIASGVALEGYSSGNFTNGKGGVVAGSAGGHLLVSGGYTFVAGLGKTEGSEPVVVESSGYLEYTGGGEGHVVVRNSDDAYLRGTIGSGQTLTLQGSCASPYGFARLYVPEGASNAGTIEMTSSGCAAEDLIEVPSGKKLTNTGTIAMRAGIGGERALEGSGSFVNKHTMAVEAGASGALRSGTFVNEGSLTLGAEGVLGVEGSFTNAEGGVVAGTESGHLRVWSGGTFVAGEGKTEGSEPVVVESSGYLEYTGGGEGHVVVRNSDDAYLRGTIGSGQTLTLQGSCASPYGFARLYVPEGASNAGTIEMTSSGCAAEDLIEVPSGKKLTNTGTIAMRAGIGGERALEGSGSFVNKHTMAVEAGASGALRSGTFVNEGSLTLGAEGVLGVEGSFANAEGGVVAGTESGHLRVWSGGTFVAGEGKTSGPEPVVAEESGYLEYTGGGEGHVVVRNSDYTYLRGTIGAGQTLTIEGSCASPYGFAGLYAPQSMTSAGTISLESTGCAKRAVLETASGQTFTSTGTIETEAGGGGGELDLYGNTVNEGSVSVASGTALHSGTFTNGSHGVVSGSGSGHLLVASGDTFVEGEGRTSGAAPVVAEEDGRLEYTGGGESHVLVRNSYETILAGALRAAQTLTIEGTCESPYGRAEVYAPEGASSAGTIVMRSTGCANRADLEVAGGKTFTNTGTIETEAGGGGGELDLYGNTVNEGSVSVASGTALHSGTFTNGSHGVVSGSGSGHLLVASGDTFVEGEGRTSGAAPVVAEEDGRLEYTGGGESHVLVRNSYETILAGALRAAQTLTIEGTCESPYGRAEVYAPEGASSAGTIVMRSTGCANRADLEVAGGKTFTNTGTIETEAGGGTGELTLGGAFDNERTLAIAAGTTLHASQFTQAKSGTLRTAIASASSFGALSVSGTATLAGSIEPAPVGGFKAANGSKFAVLTSTARSATFEFEKNGAIGGGLYYKPVYSSEDATLEASESPPEGLPVNTGLPHVYGTARSGHTLVLTHGSWTHEPFEYTDRWLECNGSGGACKAIAGATGSSYLLTRKDVDHTIRAQETATDSGGEGLPAQSAATAPISELELHADAGGSIVATVGHEATLDGSNSTPAGEIDSYRWDFGDGHSETAGAIAHHIYTQPTNGKPLKATLTVTHESEEATSTPVEVTVLPAPGPSEALAVTVEDESGHQLEGAEVAYIAPGGAKTQARTEHGPALLAGLPDGTDTLYAYAPGYRPAAFKATVEEHHGTASVKLASGAPVETKLKSKELTLAEIEADGIDTSDPANRNVYDFELRLAFTHENHVQPVNLSGYVNSEGEFIGGVGSGGYLEGEPHGPEGWDCQPTQCEYVPPGEGAPGDWHIIAQPIVVDGHPLIQWLIIKGKASFLKQFFEVSMVIQNLSEPEFGLTAGQATLNLPPGLTLAPTAEPQHAQDQVGAIPGGGSAEADWIVRGDEEGEYWPSATYESHLEPFDALVTSQAALAKPMHVWGKDALELKVEGDEEGLVEGVPWHFKLGVRDKADIPLYDVELQLEEEPHANFDWQPRQPWGEMFGELKPGESVFVAEPYVVVPNADSVEGFQPEESSATFAGEKIVKGRGITKVKRLLPVEKLAAPEDTPGYVHLEWQAVPEATGYEVYSTPELTTSFANAADQVATSAGGATEATLSGTARNTYEARPQGEYRWYAVTAIIKGHRRLELNTVRAKPAPGEPEGPPGPPEIGRCVTKNAGEGKYSSSKCTSTGGKDAYEWLPGMEKAGVSTTLATGAVTLETKGRFKVACTGESSTAGGFHGAKRLEGLTLKLTGCAAASQPCTSSGANAGEIVSGGLNALVGIEKLGTSPAKDKAALSFFPPGHKGTIAAFSCGSTAVVLRGAVLVPVKANKPATTQTLKFKASKGVQKPEAFAGGAAEVLEESTDGGAHYEQAGLTAGLTLKPEETVEFNTAF